MQLSVVFTKFVQKWAQNKKKQSRVFKMEFSPEGECQTAVEVSAGTKQGKYRFLLVTPIAGVVEEEELFNMCLQLDGIQLVAALKGAEVDNDTGMLEAAVDISEEDSIVSISFAGGDVVEGTILDEGLDVALPDCNEEHDVRYDTDKELFSFNQQGTLVVCNTLDGFSVQELQTIRYKFDKGVEIPEDNSEKYCKKKKVTKETSGVKSRTRAAAAAAKFKNGESALSNGDDEEAVDLPEDEDDDDAGVADEDGVEDDDDAGVADEDEGEVAVEDDENDGDDDAPESKPEPKKKKKGGRRTKEEKLADDIEDAKKLLIEQGYSIGSEENPKDLESTFESVTQKMLEAVKLIEDAGDMVSAVPAEPAELDKKAFITMFKEWVAEGKITLQELMS